MGKNEGTLIVTPQIGGKRNFTFTGQYYHYLYRIVQQHQTDYKNDLCDETQGLVKTKDFIGLYKAWKNIGAVRMTKMRLIEKLALRGIKDILTDEKHKREGTRILAEEITLSAR